MSAVASFIRRSSPGKILLITGAPLLLVAILVFSGVLEHSPAAQAIVVAATIWAVIWSFIWWFRIDEAAREAHKFAWVWGGSLGAGTGLLIAATAPFWPSLTEMVQSLAEARSLSPAGVGFTFGAIFLGIVQSIGYGIVWAAWWVRGRMPAAGE